jgi:hypothetical protein
VSVKTRNVALAATLTVTVLVIAGIVALELSGRPQQDLAPVIASIMGVASPVIVSLLTLIRVEDVSTRLSDVQGKVNGHLDRLASAAGIPSVTEEDEHGIPGPETNAARVDGDGAD